VHGAALAALAFTRDAVSAELNAAADSPLVLADGRILSTANFTPAAWRLPPTCSPSPRAGRRSRRRAGDEAMLPDASGLPKFLSPVGGNRAGFAPVQKTLAALRAECRHAANPGSLDFTPAPTASRITRRRRR